MANVLVPYPGELLVSCPACGAEKGEQCESTPHGFCVERTEAAGELLLSVPDFGKHDRECFCPACTRVPDEPYDEDFGSREWEN